MSFLLTRMFAYFTLVSYLVIGSAAVRILMPETTTVSFTTSFSTLFTPTEIKQSEIDSIVVPELSFNEIKFPVERKLLAPVIKKAIVIKPKPAELEVVKVAKNELAFNEPIKLMPIHTSYELSENLVSLYKEFKYEMIAQAEQFEDTISTKLAASVEPEFFEYEKEKEEATKETNPVKEVVANNSVEDFESNSQSIHTVDDVGNVEKPSEKVEIDDLITFDYAKAQADVKAESVPTISKVTTQNTIHQTTTVNHNQVTTKTKARANNQTVTTQPVAPEPQSDTISKSMNALTANRTYPNRMTIQISGTDLNTTQSEVGFEIRYQDDLTEAIQDYNSGSVSFEQDLAEEKMTRAVTILKRGYAPTNTDLILEEGETSASLPLIEENTFNELLAPYEARGPIGAVLVELEDDVEGATLDVPYSQVLRLDADMKKTKSDDFSYQLFLGVKAGNALLSYKGLRGEVTSKIIHVHERELTFETNFFEEVLEEKVSLLEEDLLAKEKAPLIISEDQVKEFATTKSSKKINDHTYQMDFNRTLLGGRKYLELTHQNEPVFIGFKEKTTLEVPSESFMRYILSRFEGSQLGNRCLVQVNLARNALKVDVAAESLGSSLMTYTQILDADGKFYDSVGAKSRKVIVVGENQGAPELGHDARINLKITYQDGSVQYLGSYCSPNTYLVEQL